MNRPPPRLFPRLLAAMLCGALVAGAALPPAASAQATIYRCTDAAGDLTVQNQPCPAGTTQREQLVQGIAGPPTGTVAPSPAMASDPSIRTAAPATSLPQVQDVQRSSDGGFVTTSTGPEPRILDSADLPRTPAAQDVRRSSDGGFVTTSVGPDPRLAGAANPAQRSSDGGTVTTSTGPEPRILDSATLRHASPSPSPSAEADPGRPPPPPLFRCTTYDGDSYLSEDEAVPPRCLPLRTVGLDGNPATGAGQACEVVRDQCARVPDDDACEAWRRHAREAESRWRFAHPDNVERRRAEYERLARLVAASCGAP